MENFEYCAASGSVAAPVSVLPANAALFTYRIPRVIPANTQAPIATGRRFKRAEIYIQVC